MDMPCADSQKPQHLHTRTRIFEYTYASFLNIHSIFLQLCKYGHPTHPLVSFVGLFSCMDVFFVYTLFLLTTLYIRFFNAFSVSLHVLTSVWTCHVQTLRSRIVYTLEHATCHIRTPHSVYTPFLLTTLYIRSSDVSFVGLFASINVCFDVQCADS